HLLHALSWIDGLRQRNRGFARPQESAVLSHGRASRSASGAHLQRDHERQWIDAELRGPHPAARSMGDRRLCARASGEPEHQVHRHDPGRAAESPREREQTCWREEGGSDSMSMTEAMRPHLDRLQSRALIVGAIGIAATVAGLFVDSEQFYRSYLMGFLYWAGFGIGSLSLLMLHHMVGGGWGVAIRRGLEAGARTIWIFLPLAIPIVIGAHSLYEWTHADVVAKDPV